jgi:hypothetical protein
MWGIAQVFLGGLKSCTSFALFSEGRREFKLQR